MVDGADWISLGATVVDLRAALEAGADLTAAASAAMASGQCLPLDAQTFAPLVPEPGKIICLGLNYFDHAKEGGRDKPDYPWFFYCGKTSLMGTANPACCPCFIANPFGFGHGGYVVQRGRSFAACHRQRHQLARTHVRQHRGPGQQAAGHLICPARLAWPV